MISRVRLPPSLAKPNNPAAIGAFYEGIITQGYTSDATDAAIQANIVSAGYGK